MSILLERIRSPPLSLLGRSPFAPPLCWAELSYLPCLPDSKGALRLPLLRLATGLLFSQRTPMRPREPIITSADEFAMSGSPGEICDVSFACGLPAGGATG